MNWDPNMLQPSNLAMWRIILGWSIGLPLIFAFFMFYVFSAEVAIAWTESAMRESLKEAGSIKKFFLEIFVGPVLAIVFLILLWMFIFRTLGAMGDRRQY